MHTTGDQLTLVYVTDSTLDSDEAVTQLGFGKREVSLSVVTSTTKVRSTVETGEFDCLLVAGSDEWLKSILDVLEGTTAAVPAVVFAAGGDPAIVDQVLRLDAGDIVRSCVADTPPSLIRRRIEGMIGADPTRRLRADLLDRYETILHTAPDPIYQLDANGVIVDVNDTTAELTGYSRAELVGTDVSEIIDDESLHAGEAAIRELLAAEDGDRFGEVRTVEVRLKTRSGDRIPCEARISLLTSDGDLEGSVGILRDLRKKHQRDQELAHTQALLTEVEQLADVGAWEIDVDTDTLYWTDGTRRIHGVGGEFEPTVESALECYHPDDRADVEDLVRTCIETGESYDIEARLFTEDGQLRWVRTLGEPIEQNDRVSRVRGFIQDITEQKEREREVHTLKERLELAVEGANLAVWDWDMVTDELEVNNRWAAMLGEAIEDIEPHYDAWKRRVHPDDIGAAERALEDHVDGETQYYDTEYRMKTADGGWKWVRDIGKVVERDEDGEPTRAVGIHLDIDERKTYQRTLEEERDMFAEGPAVIFKWRETEGWPVEYASDNVEDVFGYDPEALETGKIPSMDLIHEDDRDRVAREVEANSDAETDRFSHEPYRIVTADGEVRWVLDHTKNIREDGEITHRLGYLVDITERKERERQLQHERDLIERIYEASPIGIGVMDVNGLLTRVNEQTAEIFGVDREQLLEQSLSEIPVEIRGESGDLVPPDQLPASIVAQTGEPLYGYEAQLVQPDGEEIWFSWNGDPILDADGNVDRIVATIEDITNRKERAAQIETQRNELAQLDRINRIIRDVDQALLDAKTRAEIEQAVCDRLSQLDRYKFAAVLERVGEDRLEARAWTEGWDDYATQVFPTETLTPETSAGMRALETGQPQMMRSVDPDDEGSWRRAAADHGVGSLVSIPITYEDREYGIVTVYAHEADAFSDREQSVLGELGETVGHAIAAVESREREQTLTALYEATQDLLIAESREEICDVVVETASDVLEPEGIGIFLFDNEENVLKLAATTDELLEFYVVPTSFEPGGENSETWETYVTGEPKVFDDIRTSEHVTADTAGRGALFLPLGDHGVFVVASTKVGAFDEAKRRLVGLLATTTEAALDRVAGQVGIRERDRRLAEHGRQLDRLERILAVRHDIDDLLRSTRTRAEMEDGVCEQLTRIDQYAFAWIGRVDPDGKIVQPGAWAGVEDDYLDDVALSIDGNEPTAIAARTGTVTTVSNIADGLRDEEWAREAVIHGFQSVTAVPLVYRGTTYGILTVYADEPDAFDDVARSVLTELGETLAYTINNLETKQAILSEQLTELELVIGDGSSFLNSVAEIADEQVVCREMTPEPDGTARVLFELTDPPVSDVLGLEDKFVAVESLTHDERAGKHLFSATLSGETVAAVILNCGGIPQQVVAEPTETRATVQLPPDLDVRVFLTRFQEHFPEAELLSRRTVDRTGGTHEATRLALEEKLTDRQREVLVTAYETGYFQSPRETTGKELAELLGISQPTVTHHLREAQRRLFMALLEQDTLDN